MDPETRSQMRTDQNKAALRSLFELAGEHGYSERITRAGLPTATTLAGRSLTTTTPAPTTVFSPMLTPGPMITSPPSQTLSATLIGWGARPRVGPAGLSLHRMGRGQELDVGADLDVVTDGDGGHVQQHAAEVDEGPRPDVNLVAVVAGQRRGVCGAS